MFKRSTKITSLLVAAASVATMVPAMAADKIADKDGTVYNAIAYKDGKFYIDGDDLESVNDKDGVYYLDGGKYTEVDDDIDSGDNVTGIYGTKYVEIEDGDYYVDLTNGKVTDDLLKGDDREDAASALKKKIRKDDPSRYTESTRANQAEVEVKTNDSYKGNEIWEINAPKFSEPYYETNHYGYASGKAKFVVDADGNTTTDAVVYTDKDGKYIDVNNDLGKVNLVVARDTTADAVNFNIFDNNSNKKDIEQVGFDEVGSEKGKDKAKYAIAVEHIGTLGSDEKYVYRLAALHVGTEDSDGNFVQLITTDDAVYFGSTKNPVKVKADTKGRILVIQKFSKEQGDDKDDAKLPKTTQTYLLNEYKDAVKKNDKAADSRKGDFFFNYSDEILSAADMDDLKTEFTVADGRITAYGVKEDKFKAVSLSLASKNGTYYVDKDDDDIDWDDDDVAYDTDKDGNIWALEDGKIYKYNNKGDFGSAVYKVDGGYNELSVYDEKNLIAYNEDDDQYAIVGGKSSTGKYGIEDENKDNTTTTAAAGWVQDSATGAWSYVKADGTKAIGWFQSPTSGLWYYMDANGIMKTNGWLQDGASWYYLDVSGAMKTGWVNDRGTWYYLKETAGNKGAMQTGWIQWKGKWYYCNTSGAMLKNTTVGGYRVGADGAWIK
jgi:glucan-binding YG repeat protein